MSTSASVIVQHLRTYANKQLAAVAVEDEPKEIPKQTSNGNKL